MSIVGTHIPLPQNVTAKYGWTDLIKLVADDVLSEATVNTAQTLQILNVYAGDAVLAAKTYLKTPLKDASDAAFNTNTFKLGDGGDDDRLITSQELNENGSEVIWKIHPSTTPYVFTADDTIDAVFGSMAAKALSDIDTGEIWIYLRIERGSQLVTFA